MNIRLHQVTHWLDPALPTILDIYQVSFPPNEQMRLSWWVGLLNGLSQGSGSAQPERLLYAALGESPNNVVGFAYCEVYAEPHIAYLLYLAMHEDVRGQGIGAVVYRQLAETLFTDKHTETIVFEVEKPEIVAEESPHAAQIAERRIAWYRRQGALLLEGIHYVQSVGWQPAVEMDLMYHSPTPISPEQAFTAAAAIFGTNLKQTGDLRWRPIP